MLGCLGMGEEQDHDVRLEDVAPQIKAAMFSRAVDPTTPGLVSSLSAQVPPLHRSE